MKKTPLLLIILMVLTFSCKRDDEVYTIGGKNGLNPDALVKITSISSTQQQADTASFIIFTIQISPNADTASHTIHLNTTLGAFADGHAATTITADADGVGKAYLKSNKVGPAVVSFTSQNITAQTIVNFTTAFADNLLVTADKYTGDSTVSFSVTTVLSRSIGRGIVSDPLKIWFTVSPSTPGKTLICPTFSNSAGGVATVTVTNPYGMKGSFTLQGKTLGNSGDTLRQNITLVIK